MNKLVSLLFFISLFTFIHCGSDDEMTTPDPDPMPEVDYTDLGTVTGFDFFDANGQIIGRWGFPNHNPKDGVLIYPNPGNGALFMFSNDPVDRIWLIPAECGTDSITMDIPELSADLSYDISTLEGAQIRDIATPGFNQNMGFNFEDVAAGFYRLFYQMESGEIFWVNLYIDSSQNSFPDYFQLIDNLCD